MTATTLRPAAATLAIVIASALHAQVAWVDGDGREWRQLTATTNLTWLDVASVCPTDGQTPGVGTVRGVDMTGWTWARQDQVLQLLGQFAPDILETGAVGGPAYTLPGLGFFGLFTPTSEFYTVVGGFFGGSGWTATEADGIGNISAVSAQYNPHDGAFSVLGSAAVTTSSTYRGAWMFRAPVICHPDLNGDGAVNFEDLNLVLENWGVATTTGDATNDGVVDFNDLDLILGAWGTC